MARERLVHGRLDAAGTVLGGEVAHGVRGDVSLRVRARIRAVGLLDGLRERRPIRRDDGTALDLRALRDGVVVVGERLVVVCLEDLNVGEVGHQQGKHHREHGHERHEPVAEGHAAQDAGLRGVKPTARACMGTVHHGGHGLLDLRLRSNAAGALLDLGLAARSLVAGLQQQPDDDEAGQKRAAALTHERERDARERQQFGDAAHDEKRLHRDCGREANRGERGYVGLCARGRGQPAHGKQHVADEHGGRAKEAHLFSDGREDEVALDDGNELGKALADAGAHEAAVRERVQRLHDLQALAGRVLERVEPDLDARLDVAEEVVAEHAAHGQKQDGHEHVSHAAGADVQHDHEEREEEKGAAQVTLEHHDQKGHAPHEHHGSEHARSRQVERACLDGGRREHLAVLCEVGREEQHDEDLCELAGLERERPQDDPELGAAARRAYQHGQEQQRHADDAHGELVLRQRLDAGHEHQHGNHGRDGKEEPGDLAYGKRGREPRDERDADAREQEDKRKDGGVGLRRKATRGEVRDAKRREQPDGDRKRREAQRDLRVEQIHCVQKDDGDGGRYQQAKLRVPARVDCPWHRDYSPPDAVAPADCDESLAPWSESDFAFALSAVIAASVLSVSIWSR